ncbi:MAG: DUF4177 domain-containing protein [Ruminococcaceae bacterium]|nr:DUF4177 domain-containing protein [Oscillospiraceae bacterium]
MKKYEYVSVDINWIFGSGNTKHREIIDKYAADGYVYKGYIPISISAQGRPTKIDLIFEIETEETK